MQAGSAARGAAARRLGPTQRLRLPRRGGGRRTRRGARRRRGGGPRTRPGGRRRAHGRGGRRARPARDGRDRRHRRTRTRVRPDRAAWRFRHRQGRRGRGGAGLVAAHAGGSHDQGEGETARRGQHGKRLHPARVRSPGVPLIRIHPGCSCAGSRPDVGRGSSHRVTARRTARPRLPPRSPPRPTPPPRKEGALRLRVRRGRRPGKVASRGRRRRRRWCHPP